MFWENEKFKLLNCQVVRIETNSSLELNPFVALAQRVESTEGRGERGGFKIQMLPVLGVLFYHNSPKV